MDELRIDGFTRESTGGNCSALIRKANVNYLPPVEVIVTDGNAGAPKGWPVRVDVMSRDHGLIAHGDADSLADIERIVDGAACGRKWVWQGWDGDDC